MPFPAETWSASEIFGSFPQTSASRVTWWGWGGATAPDKLAVPVTVAPRSTLVS